MAHVSRFDTPGSLRDVAPGSALYDRWHDLVAALINSVTPGSGGGEFFDPSDWGLDVVGERALVWMGVPRTELFASRDDRAAAFARSEDRDVQNEYLEWHTTRNAARKVVKVVFVTETPEYWSLLAEVAPARVLELYRDLVSPAVAEADVFPGGVYAPRNRWNTSDGIVHYIQGINTLRAAIGLAQGSVSSGSALDNFDTSASIPTSADPRVILDVGTLSRKALSITLSEPIGLYIAGWDDTGWTKPDGTHVGNYWTVRRGAANAALRLEYQVPASEGFVVGDIRIGGRRIENGAQMAEHVTVMARGIAGRRQARK